MSLTAEARLRRFLLALVVCICGGTLVELLLVEHTGSAVQFIPLVAGATGMVVSVAALRVMARGNGLAGSRLLTTHRYVMIALLVVSALGVYQHIRANYLFVREIQPATSAGQAFFESLTGASPLLASGILAVAGVCGLMATVDR